MANIVSGTLGVLLAVGFLILNIIAIIGLVYLTKFSFNAKPQDDKNVKCVKMSDAEQNFSKVTVIVLWVTIGLNVLGVFTGLFMGNGMQSGYNTYTQRY